MKPLIAKAVSTKGEWVYGYPVMVDERQELFVGNISTEIIQDTICYCINSTDKNGRELYVGDIVNDFGGGITYPDYIAKEMGHEVPDGQEWITIGDDTRLGTIIHEDGTIRIETNDLDYAYNISNGAKLSDMEYHGNTFDELLKN